MKLIKHTHQKPARLFYFFGTTDDFFCLAALLVGRLQHPTNNPAITCPPSFPISRVAYEFASSPSSLHNDRQQAAGSCEVICFNNRVTISLFFRDAALHRIDDSLKVWDSGEFPK